MLHKKKTQNIPKGDDTSIHEEVIIQTSTENIGSFFRGVGEGYVPVWFRALIIIPKFGIVLKIWSSFGSITKFGFAHKNLSLPSHFFGKFWVLNLATLELVR